MTDTYDCHAYADHFPGYPLVDIPTSWWRRIELRYPDDRLVVFVYTHDPGDDEMSSLMLRLQRSARRAGFTITVVLADGTRVEAEPIG